jgi:hypothetical protein
MAAAELDGTAAHLRRVLIVRKKEHVIGAPEWGHPSLN